jgi:single-stranded-DNA-specific exonuclease
MIPPRLEWLLPVPIEVPPELPGFGPAVSTLLARRGIDTAERLARFLGTGLEDLPPLSLMPDGERAMDRIEGALTAGESIAIWGDYDADGMTAVAVWVLALRGLGVDPIRYVPSRLAEGYGLSSDGLRSLATRGAKLVITCDCGVGDVPEVALAAELGMDVIVTDHHIPGPVLPAAVAVVDPHRSDSVYPDPDLTGAGVAYRLASALVARHGITVPDLAAVAALGTIADMAPMTGESRVIVRLGLDELATTAHPGLQGLLRRAGADPAHPTDRDIGFGVVPRLNAAGRIADAELALDLLVERDAATAERLLDELETVHLRRRELTKTAIASARALAAKAAPATGPIALRDDSWPVGLLGLVAGRLADELGRPVAAAALVELEVRGSVRATTDFNVVRALEACGSWLTKRGGHAAAGGFSTQPETWDAFASAFGALPRPFPEGGAEDAGGPGRLAVDLVLPARMLTWDLLDELGRLAPYGPGNADPVLAVTGLTVGDARRVGAGDDHLSFRLRRRLETVDAIAFGVGPDAPIPEPGQPLDVVGTLEQRTIDGEPRLQIRVVDYATSEASPIAGRRRLVPGLPVVAVAGE